jgi:hypothetical protein
MLVVDTFDDFDLLVRQTGGFNAIVGFGADILDKLVFPVGDIVGSSQPTDALDHGADAVHNVSLASKIE